MAGRGNGRGRSAACTDGVRAGAEEREVRQEMPMCRHVHSLPANGGMERQLCQLQQMLCEQNRMLCEQNRMLCELLQIVRERNR